MNKPDVASLRCKAFRFGINQPLIPTDPLRIYACFVRSCLTANRERRPQAGPSSGHIATIYGTDAYHNTAGPVFADACGLFHRQDFIVAIISKILLVPSNRSAIRSDQPCRSAVKRGQGGFEWNVHRSDCAKIMGMPCRRCADGATSMRFASLLANYVHQTSRPLRATVPEGG